MQGTLIVEFGWCGFGRVPGDMAGVCLGCLRVRWMPGSLEKRTQGYRDALKALAVKVAR